MTGDSAFSMFNLSLKDDWVNNKKFCHRLSDDEDEVEDIKVTRDAQDRLAANKSRQSSPTGAAAILMEDKLAKITAANAGNAVGAATKV